MIRCEIDKTVFACDGQIRNSIVIAVKQKSNYLSLLIAGYYYLVIVEGVCELAFGFGLINAGCFAEVEHSEKTEKG